MRPGRLLPAAGKAQTAASQPHRLSDQEFIYPGSPSYRPRPLGCCTGDLWSNADTAPLLPYQRGQKKPQRLFWRINLGSWNSRTPSALLFTNLYSQATPEISKQQSPRPELICLFKVLCFSGQQMCMEHLLKARHRPECEQDSFPAPGSPPPSGGQTIKHTGMSDSRPQKREKARWGQRH